MKSNRCIKCPEYINHGTRAMTKAVTKWEDAHKFLTKRGVSPGNSPCVDIVTCRQDWGDVTCKDEQRMGGADDSSWGWL